MEYRDLARLYHIDKSSERDSNLQREYESRFEACSAFRTGFPSPTGELFFTVPRELSLLSEDILRTERRVSILQGTIPEIAENAIQRNLVLEEVVSTNLIEDIHSTRRQVKDAIIAIQAGNDGTSRFRELATLYLDIIDDTGALPQTPKDIRALYDRVTEGEIPLDRQPDGKLFRTQGVTVVGGGTRVLHEGLEPESKIVEALDKMLSFAHDPQVPLLYRAVASHYLFEHVHPFYDGNGRTGRYLLSLFLREVLTAPTALSLSRVIFENRAVYYKAFDTVEDPLNRGELTSFLITILGMVRTAQEEAIQCLEACKEQLSELASLLEKVTSDYGLNLKEKRVVFLLMQLEAFGLFGEAPLPEVSDCLGIKDQMTRKYLASLEERGIVDRRIKRNPLTFALTEEFKDRYGIAGPNAEATDGTATTGSS